MLQQQFNTESESLDMKPHLRQTAVATTKVNNDPIDAIVTDNDESTMVSVMFE